MSSLFKKLLALRQMEYMTLDQDFAVVEFSPAVDRFIFVDPAQPLVAGEDGRSFFPELFGAEEQLAAILAGQQESFVLKSIVRNGDDSCLYFDLCVTQLDESSFARGELILFLENVTQQSSLEQSLVQASNETNLLLNSLSLSKAYVDEIVGSMTDALLVTDKAGRIKMINSAAEDLFGYSSAELIGQRFGKLVAENDFLFQVLQPNSALRETTLKDVEVVCLTKTGEHLSVAFSGSSVLTEVEGVYDFLYIGRDITDRQRTQQRLVLQYSAARILSESDTLSQAVTTLLPTVCQHLGWDVTNLWIIQDDTHSELDETQFSIDSWVASSQLDPPTSYLKCVEGWCKPLDSLQNFIEDVKPLCLERGVGLAGYVWATRQPHWMMDVSKEDNFIGIANAIAGGLHAAFGFPIRTNREILGVITFFSRAIKQPDPALLKTMAVIGNQLGQFIKRKQIEAALREEQQQTERLLLNVLPETIVARLKHNKDTIAEHFDAATVLFADLVGFTEMATQLSPIELVNLLNQIFSAFDRLTEEFGLEKIKTVGDAYMVVGGVPQKRLDHASAIANMALAMQAEIVRFNQVHHQALKMRIGIHSGPIVAGVIGIKKFTYDLWGDTVNTASRMESHGLADQIQVTETTYQLLRDQYQFHKRGLLTIKGKGEMTTYLLVARL
jgi:adenylate cyclase